MSELLPGFYLVDGVGTPGRPGTVNVSLLVSGEGTATLVDAGFPGVAEKLSVTLHEAGIGPSAIRRVIVTHHHPDHTGGLPEVVALTGCEVWAHARDADVIDGSAPRRAPEWMPAAATSSMHAIKPAPVDLRLVGGETLAVLGGCRILHTPGHTPGHLALYLPELSLLIAGDTLRNDTGTFTRPPERFTADREANEASLHELAELSFERILPYHGEFVGSRARDRMLDELGLR
jgi:glyoxylase-like metal-dependent hydrolase (beta-lactamase superfamily II)